MSDEKSLDFGVRYILVQALALSLGPRQLPSLNLGFFVIKMKVTTFPLRTGIRIK